MDVARASDQIDALIERRARGAQAANEEEDRQRAANTRRTHAVRLVNAKAWAEYFEGLALASHDQAARYAEKRDEALALVRKLETNNKGAA